MSSNPQLNPRRGERAAQFFGLRRNLVLLLATIVLISTGEELWMRFVPKYLQAIGAAVFVIGTFDALRTAIGAVYAYPGGVAVDRFGHRAALISFTLLSIAGYALVALVPHSAAVIGGMFLFLSWTCFSLPAGFSLVAATLAREQHSMGIAVQSVVKRLPILVGPIVGGILIDRYGVVIGVRLGLATSCLFGVIALVVQLGIREAPRSRMPRRQSFFAIARQMNAPLRHLLLSDILVRFCERIPYAWVVIYAMDTVGVSATGVGILTAIEMLIATAALIPTAYFADRYGREPFIIATFVFFTLFPITLLWANSFALLTLAFAVRGLKEFGDSARKALIIGECPEEVRARMIGCYYLIRDVIVAFGAFIGAALWKLGPRVNFSSAALLGAAGTIYYLISRSRIAFPPHS
ncbi:MAG: MFS transporter [Chthoniobacterales bacterium]